MSDPQISEAQAAVQKAYQALRAKDRNQARQFAVQAARLDPNLEDPWLILATMATPQAAVEYLKRALQINPNSPRAQKGLLWATEKLRAAHAAQAEAVPVAVPVPPVQAQAPLGPTAPVAVKPAAAAGTVAAHPTQPARLRMMVVGLVVLLGAICLVGLIWLGWPMITGVLAQSPGAVRPEGFLQKPSLTPTATSTYTPTATATFTPTATYTPTPTATFTPLPTATPTPLPTATSTPTYESSQTPPPPPAATNVPGSTPSGKIPSDIKADQRWIDVDLTHQRAYAYQGSQVVRSFVVSTGISIYPTVTGQYAIYVKYRYAGMRGDGWYLPDVPYVMYFYRGYGLHGTYWHNNFGTPMSHGCVNFKIEDAAWVYDFTSLGTLVNIHY
jgi:lipoprotein-anchoring transpeptidase ErfK/SrfK